MTHKGLMLCAGVVCALTFTTTGIDKARGDFTREGIWSYQFYTTIRSPPKMLLNIQGKLRSGEEQIDPNLFEIRGRGNTLLLQIDVKNNKITVPDGVDANESAKQMFNFLEQYLRERCSPIEDSK